MGNLLYQCNTFPCPLAISQQGRVRIHISTQDGKEKVSCQEIQIAVPWGQGDAALAVSAEDLTVSTDDPDGWDAGKQVWEETTIGDVSYLLMHFTPKTEAARALEKPAVFWVKGRISDCEGTVQILLRSQFTEGEPENFSCALEKGQADFFLRNFLSRSDAGKTFPCTTFRKNSPIYFSWESNGASFSLYQAGSPEPLAQTDQSSYVMEGGITQSTTFILRAEIPDMEPVYLYEALTLQVEDPVLGTLAVQGAFSAANAKINVFRQPVKLELLQDGGRQMWMLIADTDGYLLGSLEILHPAVGSGVITARVCADDISQECAVEADAFKGEVVLADGQKVPVQKKASLCVPVSAHVPVSLSYLISYISDPEKYTLDVMFLGMGTGTVQVM